MHLVLLHGYLLTGTGSNIYTANVAKTCRDMGHAVTIVCQDRNAGKLDFVDEFYLGTQAIPLTAPSDGTIRICVPDIDNLLLVYVYNHYDGFIVKELHDPHCSIQEIENHISKTVIGLKKVLSQGVDRILANHSLLSPVIAKRACKGTSVSYDVKIHGSAITFVLKRRPELMKYAIEGLTNCAKIVVGTSYVSSLVNTILENYHEKLALVQKIVTIPPGMDPNTFRLMDSLTANQERFLQSVKSFIDRKPNGRQASKIDLPTNPSKEPNLRAMLVALCDSYDQWSVDSDLISRWPQLSPDEPVIMYFGAYIDTKGVGEMLASFPMILKHSPKARLFVIGYGSYRENLEGMLSAFKSGKVDDFITYAKAGDFLDCSTDLITGLFRQLSPVECKRITITGILQHQQLCEILPLASVVVVPSKAAEAFGMVTVEAMSCGVLSVCAYHTGIKDVLDAVKKSNPEIEAVMRIEVQSGGKHGCADGSLLVGQISNGILRALDWLYPNGYQEWGKRREVAEGLRLIAVKNFAWKQICTELLKEP